MADVRRPDTLPNYEHQTWRTENGLPQNSVHSVVQTRDGYVWLATESGLARFDGLKFTIFDSENTAEIKSNNVRSLTQTPDQSLWIATADGLTRLQNGKFTRFSVEQGMPGNSVLFLLQDGSGVLWAITTAGAASYQAGRFVQKSGTTDLGKITTAAAIDRQGNLWLGTESGLSIQAKFNRAPPTLPEELRGASVRALLVDRLGRLWVGTEQGLLVYGDGRIRKLLWNESSGKRKITSLFEDRVGAIWVGSETGSLRVVAEALYPIQSPDSISHTLILSFFQDREGDIWVGTDSDGVTILRDRKFKTFGREQGMPDDLVRCVFEDGRGTLWAGTNAHGLKRFDESTFSSFDTANGLSSEVILSLAADEQGDLLAGTPDGLNVIHGSQARLLTSADGLPDDFVRSIYKDTDGSLWVGTRRGLAHYTGGKFTNYSVSDGLPSDLVGVVLRGRDGCLWIGTLKGLVCLRDGQIARPDFLKKAPASPITALWEDGSGVLWVGTDSGGLARIKGSGVFWFEPALGLPQTISGIAEDAHGQFWISSPHGLFSVSKADLSTHADRESRMISVLSYGTADGLPVNEFSTGGHPTIWKDRQNTIWFASAKGMVSLDARHTAPNPMPPPVVFERIIADDRVLNPADAISFGPGLSRIAFEYTGLSFAAPQQVRFQYKMEGFDRKWIDAGSRRIAYYTNLAPGSYRFVVRARNGDGVWNMQGAALSFRLSPHLYQTNWFRSLLLIAAAILAYSFYRSRVQRLRSEMSAVLAERTRIAREIHDTLAQGFVAISVHLELVRRMMSTSLESANEVLVQAQGMAQDSLAEARRSIWNLRSEDVDGNGDLPSRLSKFVRQTAQDRGLSAQLEVTGAYRALPATIESEVLRIGQEAVTNVVRHAKATRLEVKLAFGSSRAQLTICDDGQGFEMNGKTYGPEGHYGLRGMHERAQSIGATLRVSSSTGKGTTVCLEWPLA